MRRLGHATQDAALRYQHATDERDRVLAAGIDTLIREAREEERAPVITIGSSRTRAMSGGSHRAADVP